MTGQRGAGSMEPGWQCFSGKCFLGTVLGNTPDSRGLLGGRGRKRKRVMLRAPRGCVALAVLSDRTRIYQGCSGQSYLALGDLILLRFRLSH